MGTREKNTPEKIFITPEMVKAGVEVLQDSGISEYEMDGPDGVLVSRIFVAMINAAPSAADHR